MHDTDTEATDQFLAVEDQITRASTIEAGRQRALFTFLLLLWVLAFMVPLLVLTS